MSWPLDVLGLPADADATAIKRAYARLLRSARPDEDAEAFQRLNEAYRAALAHAERREPQDTTAIVTEPLPPLATEAKAVPASSEAVPRQIFVDPAAVAAQCIRIAIDAEHADDVQHSLQKIEPLWSLQIKQLVAQQLLQRLFRQPQPLPAARFDALLDYFDLNQVGSQVDAVAVARLRHHQQVMHEMQPAHHVELARRAQVMVGGYPDEDRLRRGLKLLAQPLRWDRVALASWRRGYASQLARIAHLLGGAQGGFGLDRKQSMFWLLAAAPGMSAPRYWLGFCRSLSIALCLAVLLGWITAADPTGPLGFAQPAWARVVIVACACFIALIGLWTLIAGYILLEQWQSQPESLPYKKFWLRRLFLPSAASVAVCLSAIPVTRLGATVLLWLLLCVSLRSQLRLQHKRVWPNGFGVLWIAALIARIGYEQFDPGWHWPLLGVGLAATVWLLWGVRMWKYRALLFKPRAA